MLLSTFLCLVLPPRNAMLQHDAMSLSGLLERKEISAVSLMEATLKRIDEVNPTLNAIVSLRDRQELLAEAFEADLSKDRKGWLHGIPLAVKDLSDTAGILSTKGGSPLHENRIPEVDDPFVRRLKEAGAIIIGKTNAPELGLGSHTYNGQFGRTLNPYDISRTAGGSSGGAAVAVASRMLCVADGSDMMGSLRNPAGWNNLYSLRPTARFLEDEEANMKECILPYPISTVGPIARTPSDLAMLLGTLVGSDRYDSSAFNAERDVTGYRIGWLADWEGAYPMESGILQQCRDALEVLKKCGIEVEHIKRAPFSASELWVSWTTIRSKMISDTMIEEFGQDFFLKGDPPFKNEVLWEVCRGIDVSGEQISKAVSIATSWSRCASSLFEKYDALVLPSAQMWPFSAQLDWPQAIGDASMDTYHRWMECVIPVSLAGLPCATVPSGFGESLPIGLQIFSGRGEDSVALSIAQAYHTRINWPYRQPPVGLTTLH
mmetsp:Transcript_23116/g.51295  ORF Transcript_23116/g.51295 Transcript_23116/m.51295 type:complete len:490 (+) Transcript_23116:209-1678(+)